MIDKSIDTPTPLGNSQDDQRENARREAEARRIASLSLDAQDAAIEAERRRQQVYEQTCSRAGTRQRLLSLDGAMAGLPIILPPQMGEHENGNFRCEFPGCNALPFQTQYFLNSHTKLHSSNRPHFCPVAGCPRGEGGKGFKRKNEMICHGLVHQSPGYICPFCPDREHKYPRPDNLLRHVRVHHVDIDKDDPRLRDVLAQRPEGGSRGRRRRIAGID